MRQSFQPNTEAFASMFEKAGERDRTTLGLMHQHYEREVQRMVAEGNDPWNIAHTIHGLIDADVQRTLKTPNGRKVKCTKGCSACCRIHVSITREEALLLLIACAHKGIEPDWQKIERQAAHGLGTWKDQPAADRRCVFLRNDETCGVYEHRPSACRKYMVISDPKYCDVIKYPGHDVGVLAAPEAEGVTSAMLGVLSYQSMAKALLAARSEAEALSDDADA